MSMIRVKKDKNNPFVILNKGFLNNPNLSLKAKGLLAYLLSKPDDWQIYQSELALHFTDGKASLKTAMNELINAGYITRNQPRKNGKFSSNEYVVYEVAITADRFSVGGKQDTTNNDLTNLERTKKEKETNYINTLKSEIPAQLSFFQEISQEYPREILEVINMFFIKYKQNYNEQHPFYKRELLSDCARIINLYNDDEIYDMESWETIIDAYFESFINSNKTDCRLAHFCSQKNEPSTIQILIYRHLM